MRRVEYITRCFRRLLQAADDHFICLVMQTLCRHIYLYHVVLSMELSFISLETWCTAILLWIQFFAIRSNLDVIVPGDIFYDCLISACAWHIDSSTVADELLVCRIHRATFIIPESMVAACERHQTTYTKIPSPEHSEIRPMASSAESRETRRRIWAWSAVGRLPVPTTIGHSAVPI